MSLPDWVRNGWLTEHRSSADEIRRLLDLVDRDLRASDLGQLDPDWRFAIAYNAALQAATAALAAAGYRAARDSHHLRVIESLEWTVRVEPALVRQFDAFRKKRNRSNYERGGAISDAEVARMRALAVRLRAEVERWIRASHPHLL